MLSIVFILILLICKIQQISTSYSSIPSQLSTFRTENLQISQPPFEGNILDEAIWLIKSHYIKSYLFNNEFWEISKQKLSKASNIQIAVKQLMEYFNDPYTRFIPKSVLIEKKRAIRGEAISTGAVTLLFILNLYNLFSVVEVTI